MEETCSGNRRRMKPRAHEWSHIGGEGAVVRGAVDAWLPAATMLCLDCFMAEEKFPAKIAY